MSTRSLPPRPNLAQLKLQANELHQQHRDGEPSAAARIAAHHPQLKGRDERFVLGAPFALADAQLTIAREYGFDTWARLKQNVELAELLARFQQHPRFDEAVAAMDAGEVDALRRLLAANPELVHARTNLDPPYHYFTGATLLHHVAGNPSRGRLEGERPPLPANSADIARALLDAGADVNAWTTQSHGSDTMGLLLTSKQASDANVVGPLVDVLLEYGARLVLDDPECLDPSLANHAPRAAEKLIALGARPDLFAAAALGQMEELRALFDTDGHLLAPPRRKGKQMAARDAVGLAMLYAYVREEHEAVDFLLEQDGNWNMTGVNNGTAMHRAAFAGDLNMVERLVARGADVNNRDNPYHSTPLGWADHGKRAAIVEWLRSHAAIDLHDAVCFNFLEHVESRLRADPDAVNRRLDQFDMPQSTALHWAAALDRREAAVMLLAHGADSNLLAGTGLTALDIAEANAARSIVELLEEKGALRSAPAVEKRAKLQPFETIADDILTVYQSGEPSALERVQSFFKRTLTPSDIRSALPERLGKPPDSEISIDETRGLVARLRGFGSWADFVRSVAGTGRRSKTWNLPLYRIDGNDRTVHVREFMEKKDWDDVIAAMAEQKLSRLEANGQMTDDVLARLSRVEHITHLRLGGSRFLSDDGLASLARFPHLESLDLSESPGGRLTDRGLEVLRHLPELREFHMCWQRAISDAGVANLAFCEKLESVDLLGTYTGDGAIAALVGKARLRRFKSGRNVTDAALPLLHQLPIFKTWHGGTPEYSLMSADAGPNHLLLDGSFTAAGIASLAGLDGLFGLSFFWHVTALTGAGLASLAALPRLGFLGCEGQLCDDAAMVHIGSIPQLRMLMGQGTVATDAGFAALSRSQTIEYIWGRECPNLTGRGFAALATMPALRGLAVSCKFVDDAALALLPGFPALTQLMPMDVPDAGFVHLGRCDRLDALWCMYCRDTTDAATEHLSGLQQLRTYYAGHTEITDRSLEVLSHLSSLESLEFWNCGGITDAGVARLVSLQKLREISIDGCRNVTPQSVSVFPAHVRTRYTV